MSPLDNLSWIDLFYREKKSLFVIGVYITNKYVSVDDMIPVIYCFN